MKNQKVPLIAQNLPVNQREVTKKMIVTTVMDDKDGDNDGTCIYGRDGC